MGGISGEVCFRGAWADPASVAAMAQALTPEDAADPVICDWGWVAVGHSPSEASEAGAAAGTVQSMLDERLGWCLVFDGRLDNGQVLREELDECFPFRSGTDAEIALAAYHRWGGHFVDHLRGPFALALVDAPHEKVLLARDPQGTTPLYVSTRSGRLRFSSTLPGLLAAGGIDTSLDEAALRHYRDVRCLAPAPRTIFTGVCLLPAATIRMVEARGRARDREYLPDSESRRAGEGQRKDGDWERALCEELCAAASADPSFQGVDGTVEQWLQRLGGSSQCVSSE